MILGLMAMSSNGLKNALSSTKLNSPLDKLRMNTSTKVTNFLLVSHKA